MSKVSNMRISDVRLGSLCAYDLKGSLLLERWLGFLTVRRIPLSDVLYLRLASPGEIPSGLRTFRASRARRPVYVLRPKKGRRIFLRIEGGNHFRLRQAIADATGRRESRKDRFAVQ